MLSRLKPFAGQTDFHCRNVSRAELSFDGEPLYHQGAVLYFQQAVDPESVMIPIPILGQKGMAYKAAIEGEIYDTLSVFYCDCRTDYARACMLPMRPGIEPDGYDFIRDKGLYVEKLEAKVTTLASMMHRKR